MTPAKSALSKMRARVSYRFFRDQYRNLLSNLERGLSVRIEGYRLFAIDGLELHLPRTKQLLDAGFSGRAFSHYRDSYTPRMYCTHAYDVLNERTLDFKTSTRPSELTDAEEMISNFETHSITLYDRLYPSERIMRAHETAKNYYVIRGKRGLGVIDRFLLSPKRRARAMHKGVPHYLIKWKNAKTGKWLCFMTNLPKSWANEKMIGTLYRKRWEVETSFREITETMKVEQWHSKNLNGILQELYLTLWLLNFTKSKIQTIKKCDFNLETDVYTRPNFKLLCHWISRNFRAVLRKIRWIQEVFEKLLKKSTALRIRYSRSYPRQIRGPASPYKYNNTTWEVVNVTGP